MESLHLPGLALPQGTTVIRTGEWLIFHISWRSALGLHIIHSAVPAAFQNGADPLPLLQAVFTFNLAVAAEVLQYEFAQSE